MVGCRKYNEACIKAKRMAKRILSIVNRSWWRIHRVVVAAKQRISPRDVADTSSSEVARSFAGSILLVRLLILYRFCSQSLSLKVATSLHLWNYRYSIARAVIRSQQS
jgi:hypothetical protein